MQVENELSTPFIPTTYLRNNKPAHRKDQHRQHRSYTSTILIHHVSTNQS